MKTEEKIYTPPKWLKCACLCALVIVIFLIIMVREISFTTIVLSCMAILSIGAIIDLYLSKIIVRDSNIEFINSFKKEIIKISEIEKAKIEDKELWIYLKNGKIQRMPSWFSERHSLQKILSNKIKSL